ncbi:MAG: membrane dipeptidase [Anaerolineaceae bacterium]|nr:membrane dipeptidase [Anaerolineaceae bacterium]
MPLLIDAHQDLAYNMLTFQRDYRRSAAQTRTIEDQHPEIFERTGKTLLGWPDYQRGQVALIFATIFIVPEDHKSGGWEQLVYQNMQQARRLIQQQIDLYHRLCQENSDMFSWVRTKSDLQNVLKPWQQTPADYPRTSHPVGLLLSMEGAEGVEHPDDLFEWWQAGVRIIGPVWAGGRYCGGTLVPGEFSKEGWALLDVMAEIGFPLDIAHMNERSALQALDRFPGAIIASHANARTLIKEDPHQRQLSDETLKQLIQRDGIIGMLPYNGFLNSDWQKQADRHQVTLQNVFANIDHICQMAGSARHVGIGTDFDGGFGWPEVPLELDTIADLPQLAPLLADNGYSETDINAIFYGNWQRFLERTLPES